MMAVTQSNSRKWLWLTLLSTTAVVLISQIPLLLIPEYADEDLKFFYWLYRFTDRSLFEADSLLGYQFAEVNLGFSTLLFNKVSLFYGSLYALTSPFLSPIVFSKILIFPLALISIYFLYRIGERIADPFTASLLCLTLMVIAAVPFSAISLSAGLPRSFTLPLLLAMLYFMMQENHLGMAIVLVMGLFYPPIFLTILFTYGVKFGFEFLRRRQLDLNRRQIALYAGALLLSGLLLLPAVFTGLNTVPVSAEQEQQPTVFNSPLFGNDGRYSLLRPSPLTGNGGLLDRRMIGLYSLYLVVALIPIAVILRRRFNLLPAPFWYLIIASFFGFFISWLAILFTPSATFHMPSRYTRGTIFITSLIMFAVNAPLAIKAVSAILARKRHNLETNRKQSPPHILSVIVMAGLLSPLVVYLQGPNTYYRPTDDNVEFVNFIETLPQDALIGGYPCLLDDIPLYAQRKILFSCETESRDMGMMAAALAAYFAETPGEVQAFCSEYDIDYLVTSPFIFTEEFLNQEKILFEPLNSILKDEIEGRTHFALDHLSEEVIMFKNNTFFVVPCPALKVEFVPS